MNLFSSVKIDIPLAWKAKDNMIYAGLFLIMASAALGPLDMVPGLLCHSSFVPAGGWPEDWEWQLGEFSEFMFTACPERAPSTKGLPFNMTNANCTMVGDEVPGAGRWP